MPYTIELLVTENAKQAKVLRKFLKWFEANERNLSQETRETTEFFDLQEIADDVREVLAP